MICMYQFDNIFEDFLIYFLQIKKIIYFFFYHT